MENTDDRFIVWAEAEGQNKPLIMTDLPAARLFDDVVVPYQTGEAFFVDGAPVKAKDLKRTPDGSGTRFCRWCAGR